MKRFCLTLTAVILTVLLAGPVSAREKIFVGSSSCRECHAEEYSRFTQYSKKASSFGNILKMESRLTDDEFHSCFECHTTGYGKKGGFVSAEQTPDMKNPGCEVCHGPGSLHAESGDPELINGKVSPDLCGRCHSSDRIAVFDFNPLLFGGAH